MSSFFVLQIRIRTAPTGIVCSQPRSDPSAAMSAPPAAPPPTSGTERCGNFFSCGSTIAGGPGTGLCAACRDVAYCSKACQAAQWPSHKVRCKEIRNSKKAAAAAPITVRYALPPFAPTLASAEAGDAVAQYHVAQAYASGTGVVQSWPSAFAWYKRCAAQPSAPIEVWARLGECYEFGSGAAVDEVEAVRLYRVGAALGHATAQIMLARCLKRGVGVPTPDRDAAFALFTAVAARDRPDALCLLGDCYADGAGVARDVPHAVSLWKRALAHPRFSPALAGGLACTLGLVYASGDDGVPRDAELSSRYLRKAAALGNEHAARSLRELGLA